MKTEYNIRSQVQALVTPITNRLLHKCIQRSPFYHSSWCS